jgi:hypothetical protein
MKQKYRKLTWVKVMVDPKHPDGFGMGHFKSNFTGIVEGTCSQIYGGKDVDLYSVHVVKRGKVVNCIAWYYESQLTALPAHKQNRELAEELVERFNMR